MSSKSNFQMVIILSMLTGLLMGCSSSVKDPTETPSKLKIMYYDEMGYYSQYGTLFAAMFPEIDVEVISKNNVKYEKGKDMNKAVMEFIDAKKPDLLMLNGEQYKNMSSQGKLYDLESFIKRDKFDLEGTVLGITDYIRELSDGKLYGMSPAFFSKAVYYNKDLFAKYEIPFPENGMSWDKLLQLASRFPTTGSEEERIYGIKTYYSDDLYELGISMGGTLGLSFFNTSSMKMTMNSESWKAVFESALEAIKSETIYKGVNESGNGSYESYLFQNPFVAGKVAMTIDENYLVNQITEAQERFKDKAISNWDMVTMPVNPQNPNVTNSMSIDEIFAIDARSSNIDAAWNFISYVNSDEFARIKKEVSTGSLTSRTKYITDESGHNLEALYSLKPIESSIYKDNEKLPYGLFSKIVVLMQEELHKVTSERQSLSKALENIQAQGQQLLDGK
ncbi:ABC transporter substrate-binding protein [Cohnella abietis]|uniref:Sugar ABC transporter substrate-binding protein n=1 Tax=Cohnella abietis TaxID=2507935 RepID=A0A3T1DA77_9BACL|nr:extracellular solute-binding protein [Cohnella abietis]BBI35016.1 sugar ABC transporter substrate-binding protein [Cohnella abietis]